jgi:hypothetical protein
MDSMKSLALNGRLVISVIHQPRSSIYEMFDRLLLLSLGRSIYLGPAPDAIEFFNAAGFYCPQHFNPSDFYLDVLSPDSRTPELEQAADLRILGLAAAWQTRSPAVLASFGDVQSTIDIASVRSSGEKVDCQRVMRNFKLLCWRAFAEQTRELPTIFIKIFVTCFFACIIGGIYSNGGHSQKSIANRIGLLFIICLNQGFNGCLGVLNTFPREKIIVARERSNRAYDTLSYFTAKFFVELPLNLVPALIFSCVVYYIVGLNEKVFGYFILIVMLVALTAIGLGLAISALVPTVEAALALGPPAIIIALLFGGYVCFSVFFH